MKTAAAQKNNVLVIEDNECAFRGLEMLLEDKVGVEWADQMQAVKHCSLENYSCILLDLGLPDPATGLMVLNYIRNKSPGTPIVVITGHSDIRLVTNSMRGGARDFIQKPVDAEKLRAVLYDILN